MSEDEKKAIEMLNKYITEHKLFNIKQADNLEENIKTVLHLVDEIYAKTEQQKDLLKYKTERIEELKKEIEKLTKKYENAKEMYIVKDNSLIDYIHKDKIREIINVIRNRNYNDYTSAQDGNEVKEEIMCDIQELLEE